MITFSDAPLALLKIAESGQCFRWEQTGEDRFLIPARDRLLCIRQEKNGGVAAECSADEWSGVWKDYFDLNADYRALERAIDPGDAYLRAAARAGRGMTILKQDFFETLISFIISQNNNIPRIRAILRALCEKTYPRFPTPREILALGENGLAPLKMGYRARYVLDAARQILETPLTTAPCETTDEVIARLMCLNGVGIKVASCVALFGLGRKDAFPIDTWMRRILSAHYPAGFPFARYAPAAGVYQQYMFYYERTLCGACQSADCVRPSA